MTDQLPDEMSSEELEALLDTLGCVYDTPACRPCHRCRTVCSVRVAAFRCYSGEHDTVCGYYGDCGVQV